MEAAGASARLGISSAEADEFLRLHQEIYRRFWEWCEQVVDSAMASDRIRATFGWAMAVRESGKKKPSRYARGNPRWNDADPPSGLSRTLMNWQTSSPTGAGMMRLAATAAVEAGIECCLPGPRCLRHPSASEQAGPRHSPHAAADDRGRADRDRRLACLSPRGGRGAVAGPVHGRGSWKGHVGTRHATAAGWRHGGRGSPTEFLDPRQSAGQPPQISGTVAYYCLISH